MRDAGRYTCEALNQAGHSEKNYNLNVWGEGPPGWVPPPPFPGWVPLPPLPGYRSLHPVPFPSQPPPTSHPLFSHSVPPVFPSQETRTLTVTEGHPTRLSCECWGVPFPKISWRKDGRVVGWEGAGAPSRLGD